MDNPRINISVFPTPQGDLELKVMRYEDNKMFMLKIPTEDMWLKIAGTDLLELAPVGKATDDVSWSYYPCRIVEEAT